MIDHERALDLAAARLDFPLSEVDAEALTTHLDSCDACRAQAGLMRTDAQRMAALPAHDAPDGLRGRILAAAAAAPSPIDESVQVDERGPGPQPRMLPASAFRNRRRIAVLASAAVIVALVGGALFWRTGPPVGPDVASGSPSPSGASASGPGEPTPSGQPVTGTPSETWTPIADLTADDATGGVVALASGFRLASLDGTPAVDLAKRLSVEPPLELTVVADADGRSARITPNQPLTPGAAYRFTLTADDGRTLDSWAFQAHEPLQVIATVPGDANGGVPTNTGIEVTFDQDGVVDAASHMTIVPKVAGRFEQHGRTLAFVPAKRLAAATMYTVTVSRGITVRGTGDILEQDFRFRFETAPPTSKARTTFHFSRGLFDATTSERAAIGVLISQDWGEDDVEPKQPKSVRVEVHRLADVDAAIAAYRKLGSNPHWAEQSPIDLVSTKSLTKVAGFTAKLRESEFSPWIQLEKPLPAGWYVVTLPSSTRTIQTILQVTDVSGYVVVSETRTLVWANDVATGQPIAGASVAAGDVAMGATKADGTLLAETPATLTNASSSDCVDDCYPVVVVRSGDRTTILPVGGTSDVELGYYDGYSETQPVDYWQAFDTDRTIYRRTDTINAWGVVRGRATGAVPAAVRLRLSSGSAYDGTTAGAPIATTETHPNAVGVYSAALPFDDLPEGDYLVESSVGDDNIGTRWIRIDRILKPAYRLEVVTGRHVYFRGDQVRVTATATFYEGSPVPGVPLRMDGIVDGSVKTDANGVATRRATIRVDPNDYSSEPEVQDITVTPARSEEGEISGTSQQILAFPSTWTIGATAVIEDGRMQVTGTVHAVDRDRLEREIAGGADPWGLDPKGGPIGDKTVTATFTEEIPYRIKTGTAYDFIEKKVMPVYEYGSNDRGAGTFRVQTRNDGTFAVSIPATAAGHTWRVRVVVTDPDRHDARTTTWASLPGEQSQANEGPSLVQVSGSGDTSFSIGESIDIVMKDPGLSSDTPSRFLFYTANGGIQDVSVGTAADFHTTFTDKALPGFEIGAVRFTDSRYVEPESFFAEFRRTDRELTIDLTTDHARYAPGAEVALTVTTRDPTGTPVPATVVLRGVDEKLFTIAAAEPSDPLGQLYADIGSGVIATYHSHAALPYSPEGGDTTGGGGDEGRQGRDDFRDWVLFKQVQTGSDGRAVVTFKVADDLTSWRVGASAFGDGLFTGEASVLVPVGLPFFVDATIATDFLVTDRPSIGLRAYGTDLAAGAKVTFAVDSDDLGFHAKALKGTAFGTTTVALPKLTVGLHSVTITATTGSGASARKDVLTRTFAVLPSRLATSRSTYVEVTSQTALKGGDGRIEVIVSDAGAARYIPLLVGLADVDSARLERTLAAAVAGSLLKDRFETDTVGSSTTFDKNTYQLDDGGLAILPFSSSNVEASVLAALVAPDRFDPHRLEGYLWSIIDNPKTSRERRTYALAGLAGLGAAVLPGIRAAADDPALTVRERLMIGLGAAALGDAATARSIGTSLATEYGEVTGELARLRVGKTTADIADATALMAMLAAANGDPLATRFWASVEANPSADATYDLHAVGFVTRLLERSVPRPASFAYTFDGQRQVVDIEPGRTFHLSVSHKQFGSLAIERLSGQIGVTTSWQEAVKPAAIVKDPDIKVSRKMTPSGTIGRATLVRVDLTVDLGSKAPAGCHLVTDLVPSGLVPVGNLQGWVNPEDEETSAPKGIEYPYAQVGQRVTFCAEKTKKTHVAHLRYYARVVTSGTFIWEPTVVESRTKTGRAAVTKSSTITVR